MNFNISEIKKHLGPGLGLRQNRYLIEIPVPTVNGETINILCQSAGFPERNISVTEVWHKGRKYNMRGETDFGGDYEISIVDDDEMRIRKMFDVWMKQVDNSRPNPNDSLLGASFEEISPGLLDNVADGVALANTIKNTFSNPRQAVDFAIGALDSNLALSMAKYQTDINIWQMGRSGTDGFMDVDGQKVYGYKLQNAFPKSVGIVTLDDSDENSLSQFSVTFAFSEFVPIFGLKEDLLGSVVGNQAKDIGKGIGALVS